MCSVVTLIDVPLRFFIISLMKCLFVSNSVVVILFDPSNRKTRSTVFFVHSEEMSRENKGRKTSKNKNALSKKITQTGLEHLYSLTCFTLEGRGEKGVLLKLMCHIVTHTVQIGVLVTFMRHTWTANLDQNMTSERNLTF